MWSVLRRPSWLAFTLLVLVASYAFVELGQWQLRRHDERTARSEQVAASTARPPVPVAELLQVGTPPATTDAWRQVEAVGRYDAGHELLVRNRTFAGELGYEVLTPLVTEDGPALLVDRGWVPAADTASGEPVVPPAPPGVVEVTGRVQVTTPDDAGATGLPPGQVRQIAVPDIAADLPYPVYGASAALLGGEPGTGSGDEPPRAVEVPEPDGGMLNLAYAVQWFLFVPIAVVGWVLLLRSELRTRVPPRPRQAIPAEPPRVRT